MTYPSFSAAARLIGGRPTCIHTAGHVNGCMPDVFNWLPLLPQRIMLWIAALAGRCLQGLLERFTLSHLGYQKYLLPQFRETEGVPCLFRLYFQQSRSASSVVCVERALPSLPSNDSDSFQFSSSRLTEELTEDFEWVLYSY